MRIIPACEIKRRGISAVDEAIKEGPIHVIKNDEPTYVIMNEAHHRDLVETQREAFLAGVRESLDDLEAGRVRRSTAQQLIDELGLED